MPNTPHILLYEELLEELRLLGFPLGPDTYLRVARLMNQWQADEPASLDRLKVQLSTLLASKQEEQQLFFERFDAFVERHTYQPLPPDGAGSKPTKFRWGKGLRWAGGVLAVLVLGLLAGGIYLHWQRQQVQGGLDWALQLPQRQLWVADTAHLFQWDPWVTDSLTHWEWQLLEQQDTLATGQSDTPQWSLPLPEVDSQASLQLAVARYHPQGLHSRDTLRLHPGQLRTQAVQLPPLRRILQEDSLHLRVATDPVEQYVAGAQGTTTPLQAQVKALQQAWQDSLTVVDSFQWTVRPDWDWWRYRENEREERNFYAVYAADTLRHAVAGRDKINKHHVQLVFQRRWQGADGQTRYTFHQTLEESFSLRPSSSARTENQAVGIHPVQLRQEDLRRFVITRSPEPWWWASGTLLLLWGLVEYLRRRRQRWVLDNSRDLRPPSSRRLQLDRPPLPLFRYPAFEAAARQLRMRQGSEAEEFDLPETLRRSLQRAGLPELVYRPRELGVQYLFLIQQQHPRDQQARYHAELVEELQARDITVEAWFFEDSPLLCWRHADRREPEQFLAHMAPAYYNYRLVVMGEAESLCTRNFQTDRWQQQLREEAELFLAWRQRAWLSTRPQEAWGQAEYLASSLFLTLPANEQGLQALVSHWGEEASLPPTSKGQQHQRPLLFHAEYEQEAVPALAMQALRAHLGTQGFYWLAACAVYPSCHWELTLAFGQQQGLLGAELHPRQQLRSAEILRRLLGLPWLQTGKLPRGLRLGLVKALQDEQPEQLRAVRLHLIQVLSQPHNLPEEGSLARQQHHLQLALYQFEVSDQSGAEQQALRQRLRELGVTPQHLGDALSMESLSQAQHNPLALVLPRSAFRGHMPFFGLKSSVRLAFLLLTLGLLWGSYAFYAHWFPLPPEKGPYSLNQLQLRSPADSARWHAYQSWRWAEDAAYADDLNSPTQRLQNALQQAETAMRLDSSYLLARHNRDLARFRQASLAYEGEDYTAALFYLSNCCQDTLQAARRMTAGLASLAGEVVVPGIDSLWQLGAGFYADSLSGNPFRDSLYARQALLESQLNAAYAALPLASQRQVDQLLGWLQAGRLPDLQLMVAARTSTGRPLAGLRMAYEQTGRQYPLGFTNQQGEASLRIPRVRAERKVRLRFEKQGYLPLDTLLVDPPERLTLTFEELPRLAGRVVWQLEPDFPVPGAWVRLHNDSVKTDEAGYFSLPLSAPPASASLLRVRHPYFELHAQPLSSLPAGSAPAGTASTDSLPPIALRFRAPRTASDPLLPRDTLVEGGVLYMGYEKGESDRYENFSPFEVGNFYLGVHEVTVAQYLAFVQATKTHVPAWLQAETEAYWKQAASPYHGQLAALQGLNHPMTGISWEDAQAYVNWLSVQTGNPYRLPQEQEWEYAARGGQKGEGRAYAGRAAPEAVAWHTGNAAGLQAVGTKAPNELGLYDLSGNADEWCANAYAELPIASEPLASYAWPMGVRKASRGGGFLPEGLARTQVFVRGQAPQSSHSPFRGFRVAREAPPAPPPALPLPAMVRIAGGSFEMGSNDEQADEDEQPVHTVSLDDFELAQTEVTQALWQAVMGSNPSYHKNCPTCPVESVSWEEVQVFLQRLNEQTGETFRLPTEAEWAYAARGGAKARPTTYAGSELLEEVGWYSGNSDSRTHPVARKQANELGLYDLSGNVWEWCQDWYGSYPSQAQRNPTGPETGDFRVLRGGSWGNDAEYCRVSYRFSFHPSGWFSRIGFRLARTLTF